ncbi:MAG: hypothetical protein ND807_16490 [Vicinamibacterales bacterium]|nr:hypothetical protein [Vicinamibacterales bacterium]
MKIAALAAFGLLAFGVQAPPANTPRWVEFDANFVRTQPGMRKVVGFFHRGVDGSTREDSNVDGPSKPVILITNVTTRLEYTFEGGAWTSYPLNVPPQGVRPDTIARNPRQYAPDKPIDGMVVVRFVNPQGIVQFQAPSLNYFAIHTERPGGGRETYSNINIREQPADLFLPPPGAVVTARTDGWRGPIWYPAGEAPR